MSDIEDDEEAAEKRLEQEARRWMRKQVGDRVSEKSPRPEILARAHNKLEARVRQLEAKLQSQAAQIAQLVTVVALLIEERENQDTQGKSQGAATDHA